MPPPFSVTELGKSLFTLSFFTLVTLIVAGVAVWRLKRRSPGRLPEVRTTIDLALFWGALTFGAGVFHVLMGLIVTSLSVQVAAPIEPAEQWLVARGMMIALIPGTYGILVFLLTALAWLGLRRWHRRVTLAATAGS